MNLVDVIEARARAAPHAVALVYGVRSMMSYQRFVTAVRQLAGAFVARGVTPGDVVGVCMIGSPLHLIALLALARAGAVSVAVHPKLPKARKQDVVAEYDLVAVVSDQARSEVDSIPWIVLDESSIEEGSGAGTWRAGMETGDGDRACHIGLSSGTSGGRPKGTMRTHGQILNIALLQQTIIDMGRNSRFLVAMDLNLSTFLFRVLRHLIAGNAIVFPLSTGDPGSVLDAMDRHAVTHVMASPNIVARWVEGLRNPWPCAPGIEHLMVVGGRVPPALQRDIGERFTPQLHVGYGSTEAGLITLADTGLLRRHPESVGRVVPWGRLQIVDDEDRRIPAGHSGIVRFQSGIAGAGYYRNPEQSARVFRNGWIYPGDIGRLLPDGALVIESRVDDVINIEGAKVDPVGIEDALAGHPDVVEAVVFSAKRAGQPERLYAAVVVRDAFDEQALLAYCRDRVGPMAPGAIVALREFPRNAMGKVLKHELAALVANGRYAAGAGKPQ